MGQEWAISLSAIAGGFSALTAVAAIVIGTSGLFAYRAIFGTDQVAGPARTISPEAGPTKMVPGSASQAADNKRSQDRIQILGFFQDDLEIKQTQGSAPDRVVLSVDVEGPGRDDRAPRRGDGATLTTVLIRE